MTNPMSGATIGAIAYHLPEQVLRSSDLSSLFPEWAVEKIEGKTGL